MQAEKYDGNKNGNQGDKNESHHVAGKDIGIKTNRDEWVYGSDSKNVRAKIRHLIEIYNADVKKLKGVADPVRLFAVVGQDQD